MTCRGCGGILCYSCGVCQTRLCRCEEARLANAQMNVLGLGNAINNQINADPWILVNRDPWGLPMRRPARNVNGVQVQVARGFEIPERRAEPWDPFPEPVGGDEGLEIFDEVADNEDIEVDDDDDED